MMATSNSLSGKSNISVTPVLASVDYPFISDWDLSDSWYECFLEPQAFSYHVMRLWIVFMPSVLAGVLWCSSREGVHWWVGRRKQKSKFSAGFCWYFGGHCCLLILGKGGIFCTFLPPPHWPRRPSVIPEGREQGTWWLPGQVAPCGLHGLQQRASLLSGLPHNCEASVEIHVPHAALVVWVRVGPWVSGVEWYHLRFFCLARILLPGPWAGESRLCAFVVAVCLCTSVFWVASFFSSECTIHEENQNPGVLVLLRSYVP
jgi:hypothetical protein